MSYTGHMINITHGVLLIVDDDKGQTRDEKSRVKDSRNFCCHYAGRGPIKASSLGTPFSSLLFSLLCSALVVLLHLGMAPVAFIQLRPANGRRRACAVEGQTSPLESSLRLDISAKYDSRLPWAKFAREASNESGRQLQKEHQEQPARDTKTSAESLWLPLN